MRNYLILLFLCVSVTVNATTYYVKNAGSNSNTGLSDAQAWQTLGHVPWNSLGAGDIVYLNRGDTWREQISITSRNGSSGSWITIQSYGTGAKPKILGSVNGDVSGYWTSLGGNLWASPNNSFPLETSALYYDSNSTPSKCSVNKSSQSLLTTDWDIYYDASAHRVIVYQSAGSPDTQANGIEIAKPFAATSNEGNVAVKWSKYISINDLDIRYCNSYGIKESGGNGGTGSYNTFLNCEVHYTWDKGCNFTYGDHMVIDHCIFDHCGYIGLCPTKRSALGSWGESVWVQLITYPTVRYTEMAYPHNNGIDIWGCSNGLVESCYCHDVDYPLSQGDWETGIYFDGSSNCVAKGNRLERLVIGISINAESSGDIANNILCYDNVAVNNDANYQIYCNQGGSNHINNIQFYHNISYHDSPKKYDSGWWAGFYIANCTTTDFKNNIVYNQLGGNYLAFNIATTAVSATSDYNDFYLASNSGNLRWNNGGSYSTLAAFTSGTGQDAHSLAVNPSFAAAGSDWHLQSGSGVTGKGIAVSAAVTDYEGNNWVSPPSMGVYESNLNQQKGIPVYSSSVVENATPAIIQITYNQSLANIVPAVAAFNVQVNSVARDISAVTISGMKVQLILASPIVTGDVVKLSYTIPSDNPIQTSAGEQAASISAQTVTNSVSAVIPVYASAAVANATPALLEMTYNTTLASIVPASSAFSVLVNSIATTVSSVAISGTKVQLTLSAAIKYGDIVTVSYTKPATNPLQTSTGEVATSISGQSVVNNLISSTKDATPVTLTMTLSPNHVHRVVNVLLAYSSSLATQAATITPEILRISDLSGKLFIEQFLVTGVTSIKIPLNLRSGIYYIMTLGNGVVLASRRMVVY